MKYRYKFTIETPFELDAKVLVFIRYEIDENGLFVYTGGSEVLTVDGWKWIPECSTWNLQELPRITGLELENRDMVEKRLDEWSDLLIKEVLKNEDIIT